MNKNKKRVSTSIPAFIESILPIGGTKHTTMAKLRVFYKGITSDGRRFTEEMSHKLLADLPETPVVALYDEEEEDFIGHAEEQGVFGYVPENAAVYFEEVDGIEWAVTDIKLFTERADVGRIAKKIVGKQHSLELNPNTLELELNENEEDPYWITFTGGDLIGLSVLGDWQNPAFAGSGFFSSQDQTEVSLGDIIARYISMPKEVAVDQNGGETMFLEFVTSLFGDLQIQSVLENDLFLIYKVGDKTYIAIKGDDDQLQNVDITEAFAPNPDQEPSEEEPEEVVEDTPEEEVEEEIEDPADSDEDVKNDEVDEVEEDPVEDEASEVQDDAEQEQEQEQEGVEPETPEDTANQAALNQEEREELESYRRRDKEGLISSYAEFLSAEQINRFNADIDSFTVEDLEKELSFEAMKFIKANRENSESDVLTRSFVNNGNQQVLSEDDRIVRHYLNKDTRGENR